MAGSKKTAEKVSVLQQPLFSLEDIEQILYNETSCVDSNDVPGLMGNAFCGLLKEKLKGKPDALESLESAIEKYRLEETAGGDDEDFDDDEEDEEDDEELDEEDDEDFDEDEEDFDDDEEPEEDDDEDY